jgi:ribosomal protein L3 glutamine methyltransferase
MTSPEMPIEELLTVRDWLRYGTTVFSRAGLVYGHGTASAVDEAAFLILAALHLPVDTIDPWLEARLTWPERMAMAELFSRRIATRQPASYLVNAAYIQGHKFYVDERVIVPRSYIGELLAGGGLSAVLPSSGKVDRILDMCTGSGCLAILAALAFPAARVDAVDLSSDALNVAARNIQDYGFADRISLVASDLFGALPPASRYDLIIANPPYVATGEVAAFTPEYRAEPVMAHLGGIDGLDLVHRIVAAAPDRLTPGGTLVVEIGTGREAFERAYPALEAMWLDTAGSEGEVLAVTAACFGARGEPAKKVRVRK